MGYLPSQLVQDFIRQQYYKLLKTKDDIVIQYTILLSSEVPHKKFLSIFLSQSKTKPWSS